MQPYHWHILSHPICSTLFTCKSFDFWVLNESSRNCTAKTQYPIFEKFNQIFPEMELHGLSPNFPQSCLWAIYIFQQSDCLFCCRKKCGPILGMYKSLKGTWAWRRSIPFLGIRKWDFCCSVLLGNCNHLVLRSTEKQPKLSLSFCLLFYLFFILWPSG